MRLIVYGDFNFPYSYLASQRIDALLRQHRAEVDWRAVEHNPGLSMTGTPVAADPDGWHRELAESQLLALPGEHPPEAAPTLVSNTLAAVSAYAEAVTDGVQHDLRRVLFDAIWVRGQHLSSAYDVRALLAGITYPPYPIDPYRNSPDLPPPGFGDPAPLHITRILGATIAANGIPMTTTGWRRSRQWRTDWLDTAGPVVPVVVDPEGTALRGTRGLAYLAGLLTDPQAPRARQAERSDVALAALGQGQHGA
jgi:hypothetical protein